MRDDAKVIKSGTKSDYEPHRYYEGVAAAFRYAKFIALFVAVLFFVVMISFFRSEISIENFQYVLKYISADESSLITTNKIHYPTSDSKALSLYKGDFVSSGAGGVTLYDTNGSTVLEIPETFSKPVFSFGKYGLCYDLSGYKYIIFNTFSKLHSETLDFPIADAVMSDFGNYVILTKNREYRSVINVYDKDYDLVGQVFKDKYTFNMDLNASSLIYTTVSAVDSRFLTEVYVLKLNTDNEIKLASIYDEFPLEVKFTDTGVTLITDRSISFYDSNYEKINSYSFSSESPSGFFATDKYALVYFKKNMIGSENEIKIYSSDGSLIINEALNGKFNSIDVRDDFVVIYTNNAVYRINIAEKTAEKSNADSGAEKIILQSDYSALLCFKNYAKLIDFSDVNEVSTYY